MTTWHAGITCIGDYSLKINSGVLALYYNGDEENACPYPSPQFEISNKGKAYYIKGKCFHILSLVNGCHSNVLH